MLPLGLFLAVSATLSLLARPSSAKDVCGGFQIYVYQELPRPWWLNASGSHDLADPKVPRGPLAAVGSPSFLGVPCELLGSKGETDCVSMQYLGNGRAMDPEQTGVDVVQLWDTNVYALNWLWLRYIYNNCWEREPHKANLFYVPLPIHELHPRSADPATWPATVEQSKKYYAYVKQTLQAKETFQRCGGCDHVIVLSRFTAHFHDHEAAKTGGFRNRDPFWGRMMKISYEGPVHPGLINTARPSIFHPTSDKDVKTWMDHVFSRERERSATLLPSSRPWMTYLTKECSRRDACSVPHPAGNSSRRYDFAVREYLSHTFSIQPGGEGATRRAFFDSLICGCIPVVFSGVTLRDKFPEIAGPADHQYLSSYYRFFGSDLRWLEKVAISAETVEDAFIAIENVSNETIAIMRDNIKKVLPMLLYWDAGWEAASSGKSSGNYGHHNAISHTLQLIQKGRPDPRLYFAPSSL